MVTRRRFNPPPDWPRPPEGWQPAPGWQPDPSWPPPPPGWQLWIDDPVTNASHTVLVRAGAAVVWLLLLVAATASSGASGFLIMLGLPLLVIGLAVLLRGRVAWAWLENRPSG